MLQENLPEKTYLWGLFPPRTKITQIECNQLL